MGLDLDVGLNFHSDSGMSAPSMMLRKVPIGKSLANASHFG